jgi:tetratricopeptide (TPR) repeat protein
MDLQLAIKYHQEGNLFQAENIYRQILSFDPHNADAYHYLGLIAYQVGQSEIAEELIRKAIELKPNTPHCYLNLARILRSQNNPHDAIENYKKALKLNRDLNEAYFELGLTFQEQGKLQDAIDWYQQAVKHSPKDHEAYFNLGYALRLKGNLDEAIIAYQQAIRIKPDYAEAYNNLGHAFRLSGNLDKAITSSQKALEIKPEMAEAYNSLGSSLVDMGHMDIALLCFQQAIKLKPELAEAHNNLGGVLLDTANLDNALESIQTALQLNPNLADAHFNQSWILLLKGDLEHGLTEYEWRWKSKNLQPPFQESLWNGEPLDGRTILLHAEQGLGDTIQFVRYAPLVKQFGGSVLVKCQSSLYRLIRNSYLGIDQLIAEGEDLPAFDVQAPLMSLPLIMKTRLETIPSEIPYLFADTNLVKAWKERLKKIAGMKVGICWQGNPNHKGDKNRSIPLSQFECLSNIAGVRLISLQKNFGMEQIKEVADSFEVVEIDQMHNEGWDFMDTAAVMQNLDLVITVDSAVAHLAGALGIPVWMLIPVIPDWRWLLDRNDSPWYPTMRLFRQHKLKSWQEVFEDVVSCINRKGEQ